jgi:hypothetical protein
MNHEDLERLLEQGLSGDPPRLEFREQVLRDSLATLARHRRGWVIWRTGALAAAAVMIAGVSFFLGRCSRPSAEVAAAPSVPTTASSDVVTVSSDVVAWLEAARLFAQLGMDDRMARAIDQAHSLLPRDTATAGAADGPVVAAGSGMGFQPMNHRQDADATLPLVPRRSSLTSVNRILAQSSGD